MATFLAYSFSPLSSEVLTITKIFQEMRGEKKWETPSADQTSANRVMVESECAFQKRDREAEWETGVIQYTFAWVSGGGAERRSGK